MNEQPFATNQLSELFRYLIKLKNNNEVRLPPLKELSAELGISVASLREQLEVARSMGIIEASPRKGIYILDYSFRQSIWQSLLYAMSIDSKYFKDYADLRKQIEAAFWHQAVEILNKDDFKILQSLVNRAVDKLNHQPIQIPHQEHRQLHLTIYRKLNNTFVNGILEGYWDTYELFGLNVYTDLAYYKEVWSYHQKIVDALESGNYETGYQALVAHMNLLSKRVKPVNGRPLIFE